MASPPLTDREYAYLRIAGKGDHKVITDTLGIEPTNAWNEGDINPRNNKPRKFTSWQLESGLDDTHPIKDHLETLFAKLEPLQQKLHSLSESYEIYVECVGYFPPSGHGIHLDKEVIRKAASIGAAFDLDFYYISDNGHDLDYV
ncbi:MAG: DUF4279 domain-containing protein [Gammaproteobacteria bacterium]